VQHTDTEAVIDAVVLERQPKRIALDKEHIGILAGEVGLGGINGGGVVERNDRRPHAECHIREAAGAAAHVEHSLAPQFLRTEMGDLSKHPRGVSLHRTTHVLVLKLHPSPAVPLITKVVGIALIVDKAGNAADDGVGAAGRTQAAADNLVSFEDGALQREFLAGVGVAKEREMVRFHAGLFLVRLFPS
jgi:hypothetical protein